MFGSGPKKINPREAFEKYDDDGGGTLDGDELTNALRDVLGKEPSPEEVAGLIETYEDEPGSGELSFEAFEKLARALNGDKPLPGDPGVGAGGLFGGFKMKRKKIDPRTAFDKYDADGGGTLDFEELYEALKDVTGGDVDEATAKKLFDDFDTGGNGDLDFDEFCELAEALNSDEDLADVKPGGMFGFSGGGGMFGGGRAKINADEAFAKYDADGGGELDEDEMYEALKDLLEDPDLKRETVHMLFTAYDADGGGSLDIDEFKELVNALNGDKPMNEDVAAAGGGGWFGGAGGKAAAPSAKGNFCPTRTFRKYDIDESGVLDADELYEALNDLLGNTGIERDEVHRMLGVFDADGSGALDYDEFLDLAIMIAGDDVELLSSDDESDGEKVNAKRDDDGGRGVFKGMGGGLFGGGGKKIDPEAAFKKYDADGEGELDERGLYAALVDLYGKKNVERKTVNELFELFDFDGGGSLDFEEFSELAKCLMGERNPPKKRSKKEHAREVDEKALMPAEALVEVKSELSNAEDEKERLMLMAFSPEELAEMEDALVQKGPPRSLRVSAATTTAVYLAWDPPDEEQLGFAMTGYRVAVQKTNENAEEDDDGSITTAAPQTEPWRVAIGDTGTAECFGTVTNLEPHTLYRFQCTALCNSMDMIKMVNGSTLLSPETRTHAPEYMDAWFFESKAEVENVWRLYFGNQYTDGVEGNAAHAVDFRLLNKFKISLSEPYENCVTGVHSMKMCV